jgi:uncharacterized protein
MSEGEREQATRWKVRVGDEETTALLDVGEGGTGGSLLVLGHGASTNMEHRTMVNLARTFVDRGLAVARFNFLYTEKKKGPPDRMPRLMECFAAVVESARERVAPQYVFIGGHSMGGRAASMLAADGFACDGLVLLAYPLHPAGQPEKRRDAHLPQIRQPVLCLNGTRDELCEQSLMQEVVEELPATWTMHWLEAADHGFHVLKRSGRTDEDVLNEIGDTTRDWVARVVAK